MIAAANPKRAAAMLTYFVMIALPLMTPLPRTCREVLRTRFGGDLLLRFDQALGAADEAFTSLQPVEVPSVLPSAPTRFHSSERNFKSEVFCRAPA
jgi:hypothetical protein